jgi:hypothetical protein
VGYFREGAEEEGGNGTRVMDISIVPEMLAAEADDGTTQSEVLREIVATSSGHGSNLEKFLELKVHRLKLSKLKKFYEDKDRSVVTYLSRRNKITIDEDLRLKFNAGLIRMNTKTSMIDYQLTVGKEMGLSALLPNKEGDHRFCFGLDLQKPTKGFKGKHGMLGFDPAGRMLYIGTRDREDVFLAMAPRGFFRRGFATCAPGFATGSGTMSTRHYRQMVMMFAHMLAQLPQRSFLNTGSVYEQKLNGSTPAHFETITDILYVESTFLEWADISTKEKK